MAHRAVRPQAEAAANANVRPGGARNQTLGSSDGRPLTARLAASATAHKPLACTCGGGCPACGPRHRVRLDLRSRRDAPDDALRRLRQEPGQALATALRQDFETRFAHDFAAVRLHGGKRAARAADTLGAEAFTLGSHIAFAAGSLAPHSAAGRELLAHELAHVVQQRAPVAGHRPAASAHHEKQADLAAGAALRGASLPPVAAAAVSVQRKLSMRDVGRGENSGFARLGELVARLNAISGGLDFAMEAGELGYTQHEGGTLNDFDQQMMAFIEAEAVIPLRLTNRHGLMRDEAGNPGFTNRVEGDDWSSGYVDIDDLLASSDLGLQSLLVHFLRERLATPNYARRIGSASMDFLVVGVQEEFDRRHASGVAAEVRLLRDFFADPTLREVPGAGGGATARVYTNSRRDRIRTRIGTGRGTERGVDSVSVDVVLRGTGEVLSAEDYRDLLARESRERAAAETRDQIERERLGGADEHRAGGRGMPAP